MLLRTAPRKPRYFTHYMAMRDANEIARNTGVRQRVELIPADRRGVHYWRIAPVKPVVR
jgi:hypothetical protein